MAASANSDDDPEVIQPDSVTAGSGDDDFGLDDIADGAVDLAEGAVDMVLELLGRASSLGKAVSIFAGVASILGLVLGIAATSGAVRVLWILIGGFFAIVAVGAAMLSMFRLRIVRDAGDELVDDVRRLIDGDAQSERTVIETVESTKDSDDNGIVDMSKQFFSLRDTVKGHTSNFVALGTAMTAVTSFPGLMALATVIGFTMLGFSAIFALILIF